MEFPTLPSGLSEAVESVRAGARQLTPLIPASTAYEQLQDVLRSPDFQTIKRADEAEGGNRRQLYWTTQFLQKFAPDVMAGLSPEQQQAFALQELTKASTPTLGERLQGGLERQMPFWGGTTGMMLGMAPAIATMNPVGAALVEGTSAAAGRTLGYMLPELTRPILTGQFGSPLDAVTRNLPDIGAEGLFGMGGRGIGEMASRIFGRARTSWMNPEAESDTTQAARRILEPAGGVVTAYQQSGEASRGPVRIIEDTLRNAFGSANIFRKVDQTNEHMLFDKLTEVKDQLQRALPPEELGRYILAERQAGRTLENQAANAIWESIGPQITRVEAALQKPFRVNTDDLLDFIKREGAASNVEGVLRALGGSSGLDRWLKTTIGFEIPAIGLMPTIRRRQVAEADYDQIREFIKRTGELARTMPDQGMAATANKLRVMAEKSLDDTMMAFGVPELRQTYANAKQATRLLHERFDNDLLMSLVPKLEKEPELIANLMLSSTSKKEKDSMLKALYALGPKVRTTVQESMASRLIEQSLERDVTTGSFTKLGGLNLVKAIKTHDPQFLERALGRETASNLRELASAIEVTARRPSGGASVWIRLMQAGQLGAAASSLYLGQNIAQRFGGAAAVLLTPAVLAKIMTSKTATKNFAEGLIGGPGSGAFRRLSTQLAVEHGPGEATTEFLGQFGAPRSSGGPPPLPEGFSTSLQPLSAPLLPTERVRPMELRMAQRPTFDEAIQQASQMHGLDPNLMRALISIESGFDWRAKSKAGAQGLTQLMPSTAREVGVQDPLDPYESIQGGAKHFARLWKKYGGDVALAFAAYNAGETAVDKYHGIPPYKETREYVQRGLNKYRELTNR